MTMSIDVTTSNGLRFRFVCLWKIFLTPYLAQFWRFSFFWFIWLVTIRFKALHTNSNDCPRKGIVSFDFSQLLKIVNRSNHEMFFVGMKNISSSFLVSYCQLSFQQRGMTMSIDNTTSNGLKFRFVCPWEIF